MTSVVIIPNRGRAESAALTRGLINTAAAGLRPHCSDPGTSDLWLSDHPGERREAVKLCTGCPVIRECRQAAEARDERWHVWGGHDYTRRQGGRKRDGFYPPQYPPRNSEKASRQGGRCRPNARSCQTVKHGRRK